MNRELLTELTGEGLLLSRGVASAKPACRAQMISVTVPICNEAGNLRELYDRTRQALERLSRPWEIVFVNDGSSDGSEDILDQIAEADPQVRVVHFRRNFGQTAAMMAGFDFAQGEIIVPMDGDLQNDPADIAVLLNKIDEGFDVVSGWRRDRQDDAVTRNFPSILANRLISWVSGVRLHDFGCSLKAYRREVIEGVRLYGEMHRFLPIYTRWHGAKIAEVGVRHYPRTSGESKYGLERVLKVLADLITVKFLDRFQQKPMYLFGAVGLVSCGISLCAGGYALWRKWGEPLFEYLSTGKLIAGESFIKNPLLLTCIVTAMTGVMCILMGLLAEMVMRTFYESQGKPVYMVRATRNVRREPDKESAAVVEL